MKAKLIIGGKEIEVDIPEEEYKKLRPLEEKKTGYERISENGSFFYISSVGVTSCGIDYHKDIDDNYYEAGNYFSSNIIAKNNARADKLMRQLRRFAVEHREHEIDYNSINTDKYYIFYDYEDNEFRTDYTSYAKVFGAIYFDSRKMAQIAVDAFYDELIWYFTEYKDSL